MAIPSSGPLSLYATIGVELGVTQSNVSLGSMSDSAGFTKPDNMSEFYGYSPIPQIIEYMVVAGGGGGNNAGGIGGGGGGAGGFVYGSYNVGTGWSFTFNLGGGGTGAIYSTASSSLVQTATNGSQSYVSISGVGGIYATGGGAGSGAYTNIGPNNGGSGGGASYGGSGVTYGQGISGQGFRGGTGDGSIWEGGGGGGADQAGIDGTADGGSGRLFGTNYYGGGGGGGRNAWQGGGSPGVGGQGGGGNGGRRTGGDSEIPGENGSPNTGGGAGGGGRIISGNGGSGVGGIRVPASAYSGSVSGSYYIINEGDYITVIFTGSGTYNDI